MLLNELQNSYNSDYLEQRQLTNIDQTDMASENSLLRFLLIQTT